MLQEIQEHKTGWVVREEELAGLNADALSTIFCVGNGRSCTRGTLGEERYDAFRGVYVSGLFTRAGYGLVYYMGAPNWLPAFVLINGQRPACLESTRTLDIKTGILRRRAIFSSGTTSVTVEEERFASFEEPNLLCQRMSVHIDGPTANVDFVLGIDADVHNHAAKYFKPGQLPNCTEAGLKLTKIETLEAAHHRLHAVIISSQTGQRASLNAAVRQISGPRVPHEYVINDGMAMMSYHILPEGDPALSYVFEKICVLTADIHGVEEGRRDGARYFAHLATHNYELARSEHLAAIGRFWSTGDVVIAGDDNAQLAVRYAIWATRIAAPEDNGASSIGAKNLTGDWYRGANFWDMEMFQLPMLAAISPERARNHILYRANRLNAARTLAAQDGYAGARYSWQSYGSGLEEPPVFGGFLYMQQHLNAAIGWGILHYYALTHDYDLMLHHGLETLCELNRFWASRVREGEDGEFHIDLVCGPDEIHQGIDDNAYTNRMVSYLLRESLRLLDIFLTYNHKRVAHLLEKISLGEEERARWAIIADRLHIPMLRSGVMAQFAGFADYAEPDERLVAEEGHGKDKTNKQADTLLLFQTIPGAFTREQLAANYAEYAPLCNQTSSLSFCTHALLAARLGRMRDATKYFASAAGVDLADQMGNTCHGIHGAGEGGIWQVVVQGYGGLRVDLDAVTIAPQLPPKWESLAYRFFWHGQRVAVTVAQQEFTIENMGSGPVELQVNGAICSWQPAEKQTFPLAGAWAEQELEAVIFDLDGVLVRTDHLHYQAWKVLADELGLPFDETVNHQLRGVSREESLRRIYAGRPLPSAEDFAEQCARKNKHYVELVQAMSPTDLLPGAVELLRALREAGIKCALASASKNAAVVLEKTGLGEYIDVIVDGSMVTESKPDPQGFYLAAQRARVLPWNCLGVEDAEAGVEAIHRAGMVAVGIGAQTGAAEVQFAGVNELSVAKLRKLFHKYQNETNPYLERNIAKFKGEMS